MKHEPATQTTTEQNHQEHVTTNGNKTKTNCAPSTSQQFTCEMNTHNTQERLPYANSPSARRQAPTPSASRHAMRVLQITMPTRNNNHPQQLFVQSPQRTHLFAHLFPTVQATKHSLALLSTQPVSCPNQGRFIGRILRGRSPSYSCSSCPRTRATATATATATTAAAARPGGMRGATE